MKVKDQQEIGYRIYVVQSRKVKRGTERAKLSTETFPANGWQTAFVVSISEIPDNAADDKLTLSYYQFLQLHSISIQRNFLRPSWLALP